MRRNPKVAAGLVPARRALHGGASLGDAGGHKGRGYLRIVSLALIVPVAVTYANSLHAGFVLDSRVIILDNPLLRAATWDNVVAICTHDYWYPAAANGLYRPLTSLSYLFNYALLGNAESPFGYHVINLVLHWACCVLAYGVLLQLGAVPLLAALTATLFAVHPVNTEAVTNIVGRADLLAALAVLAGLLCYIQARARDGSARPRWLALLCLAAAIGVFSKENALVLLPIVIAYEFLLHPHGDRDGKTLALAAVGIGGVFIVALAIGMWVRAHGEPAQSSALDNPILTADFWAGRATAVAVIGMQLWQLLWPATLSADYSYNQIPIVSWPPPIWTVTAWIAVGLVTAALVWQRERRPALAFSIGFLLLALLPTANLLAAIGTIRADRSLYLPLIGFTGAVVFAAAQICRSEPRRMAVVAAFILAIVACGSRTIWRNRDWHSDDTLWSSTIRVAANSAKAHKGYAATLFARGGEANLAGAREHARRAVAIRPDYIEALSDLGAYEIVWANRLAAAGRSNEAQHAYAHAGDALRNARRIDHRKQRTRMAARGIARHDRPAGGSIAAYRNLSLAYLGLGDIDRAIVATRYMQRLDPHAPQTYLDLSGLEARRGRWNEAAVALFEVVALDPGNRDAWTRLTELYQIIQPGTRAVVADGATGVAVNEDDPLVRRHRCNAWAELARIFARARLHDDTRAARRWVGQHCRPIRM